MAENPDEDTRTLMVRHEVLQRKEIIKAAGMAIMAMLDEDDP